MSALSFQAAPRGAARPHLTPSSPLPGLLNLGLLPIRGLPGPPTGRTRSSERLSPPPAPGPGPSPPPASQREPPPPTAPPGNRPGEERRRAELKPGDATGRGSWRRRRASRGVVRDGRRHLKPWSGTGEPAHPPCGAKGLADALLDSPAQGLPWKMRSPLLVKDSVLQFPAYAKIFYRLSVCGG